MRIRIRNSAIDAPCCRCSIANYLGYNDVFLALGTVKALSEDV
jgi:hypothetical protein